MVHQFDSMGGGYALRDNAFGNISLRCAEELPQPLPTGILSPAGYQAHTTTQSGQIVGNIASLSGDFLTKALRKSRNRRFFGDGAHLTINILVKTHITPDDDGYFSGINASQLIANGYVLAHSCRPTSLRFLIVFTLSNIYYTKH